MTDKRSMTPHKGGRTEQFHARCTKADKDALENLAKRHDANMSDMLIGMIRAFNDLPVIEAHVLIHGVTAWAHDNEDDAEMGRTVVLFGDGTRIDDWDSSNSHFSLDEIAEFFDSPYFDSHMAGWKEDALLLHYVPCPHCGSGQTRWTGDVEDSFTAWYRCKECGQEFKS